MGDDSREVFNAVFQVLYYLSLIVQIGIAALAFVRFKSTVSGLLIGGGFSAIVLLSIVFKILRGVLEGSLGRASDAMMGMSAASSLLQMTIMLVVVVGIVLIPSSLEKLGKRS